MPWRSKLIKLLERKGSAGRRDRRVLAMVPGYGTVVARFTSMGRGAVRPAKGGRYCELFGLCGAGGKPICWGRKG